LRLEYNNNVSIIQFIFYLGIIHIIFNFLWKWVFVLPLSIVFTVLKFDYGSRLIKIFGVYLMVSLTALFTLGAIGEDPSWFSIIFYPLLGALVIFMGMASAEYEIRKEAYQTSNFELIRMVERDANFNAIVLLGSVIFYLFVLFIPIVSQNSLIIILFEAIEWIYNIPIIGWLIAIGGIFFLLGTIFNGIFATGFIMVSLFVKPKKEEAVVVSTEDIKIELNQENEQ